MEILCCLWDEQLRSARVFTRVYQKHNCLLYLPYVFGICRWCYWLQFCWVLRFHGLGFVGLLRLWREMYDAWVCHDFEWNISCMGLPRLWVRCSVHGSTTTLSKCKVRGSAMTLSEMSCVGLPQLWLRCSVRGSTTTLSKCKVCGSAMTLSEMSCMGLPQLWLWCVFHKTNSVSSTYKRGSEQNLLLSSVDYGKVHKAFVSWELQLLP